MGVANAGAASDGHNPGFGRDGETELHKSCPLCGLQRRADAAARRSSLAEENHNIFHSALVAAVKAGPRSLQTVLLTLQRLPLMTSA
jgi:hypothetical protein